MKVLIANPVFRKDVGSGLERYLLGSGMRFPLSLLKRKNERPRYTTFPFFLAYTAALLEKEGFSVYVIDAVPLNLTESEFRRRVIEVSPDIIVFEPNTAVIDHVIKLSNTLYESTGCINLFVGAHVSVFPTELLSENPHIDFIAIGEFEITCLRLLQALRDKGSLSNINGLAYRLPTDEIKVNSSSDPIEPLDKLPPPARHFFPAYFDKDLSYYHDGLFQYSPAYYMHTSRGCPFACTFCLWTQVLYKKGKQRFFSPRRIVDEMEMLIKEYEAKEIYFDDDNFTANKHHVLDLCEEINKRDLRVAWSAMADAIVLDDEMLEKMSEAGCVALKFGLDSADKSVLRAVRKPINLTHLRTLVEKAKKLGIKTHMSVVFGLPCETKKSLEHTFKFACEIDIDSVQFSIASPCPGTIMYDQFEREGRLKVTKWDDYDGVNMSVIEYESFSPEYLERFTTQAHTRWVRVKLMKPLWVLRQIRYLARLGKGKGVRGLLNRIKRAGLLFCGDTVKIDQRGNSKLMRW